MDNSIRTAYQITAKFEFTVCMNIIDCIPYTCLFYLVYTIVSVLNIIDNCFSDMLCFLLYNDFTDF